MNTESPDWIDAWHDLYVMLGTSSAPLLGLLFVATSIHLGEVVSDLGFRVRSYNQTVYLLILLVVAVLILVPQPLPFLGAWSLTWWDYGFLSEPTTRSFMNTGTTVIAAA